MKELRLVDTLAGEIVRPNLDLAQAYAELSIEAITDNPIIKEIPLVKTAAALFKTGMAIRERHFIKKLLHFLHEFHADTTANKENVEFRERINSDLPFREKVVGHLLVIIDRYVTIEKAQIVARLFRSHIAGEISWEDFVSLSIVIDALQPSGYKFLEEMSAAVTPFSYHGSARDEEALLSAAGIGTRHGTKFSVTRLGQTLFNQGLMPLPTSV